MFPVVLATNNNFCIHAAALLRSIQRNSYDESIEIHVFADNLTEENKDRLRSCTKMECIVHEINDEYLRNHLLPKKVTFLPRTAYFRFLIQEIFKDYERVLYLDVDTLVFKNLMELHDIDFEDNLCLAVEDFNYCSKKIEGIYKKYMKDQNSKYFNSGVMVININEWIKEEVTQRAVHTLENEMKDPEYADQEVLNVVLENKWKAINRIWNYPPHVSDYHDLPNIIHFMGNKPMYKDYKDRHKDTFYDFLKGTAWENQEYGFFRKAIIKGPFKIKTALIKLFYRYTAAFF